MDNILTEDQIARIKAFKEILGDVNPLSLDRTIEDFELDVDPNKEIKIWEHIAAQFKEQVTEDMGHEDRRSLFRKILTRSMYDDPLEVHIDPGIV